MSRVDLREVLDPNHAEVAEHLGTANGLLLAADPLVRQGRPAPRQVRELFRALHTVKGLSSMVGVEPVVALAHRMEAVLRHADRAGGALAPGAVDLLLKGVAAIESRTRALAEGREITAPPAALLDAMDALDGAPAPKAAAGLLALDPTIDAKLAAFEREALASGVREGRRAVAIRFAPSPERAAAGLTINTVRERLATVAETVRVMPLSVPSTTAAPAGIAFLLLVLTTETDEAITRVVGVDAEEVSTVGAAPAPDAGADEAPRQDPEPEDDAPTRAGFVRVDVARLDDALEHLSAVIVGRSALAREVVRLGASGADVRALQRLLGEQQRQVRDLRGSILRVRMVPVAEVLERVPLVVRALRRSTGKAVRLQLDAGRAELDKAVAERIFPAIVHLVRNAVDHGLEGPDERRSRGKPEEGVIRIACETLGTSRLELRVSDDGRGVDAAAVAARAGRPIPATDAALLQLLCRPGLSTRDEASATSGRGMGMDIVRKVVVDELGGELALETSPGAGTTFRLRIPLTISIVDAFTFECGAHRFVVPLATIDEIVDLDESRLVRPPGRSGPGALALLERRGEAVPLLRLDELLGLPSAGRRSRALVVRREGEVLAFAVDRMVGQQEVVVRPLEDPLLVAPGVTGATDLGDGRATLVIDLLALGARLAQPDGVVQ